MSIGVIPYFVSVHEDRLKGLRIVMHVDPNRKKGRFNIIFIKDLKDLGSYSRVGPVVKCESDFFVLIFIFFLYIYQLKRWASSKGLLSLRLGLKYFFFP